MPFAKGNKEAEKKGKHEKTKQWEALGEAIRTKHSDRFNAILESSDDDTFMKGYMWVLEFFKPKLGRTDIKMDAEINITPLDMSKWK
jgi:hypothetical protein